MNASLLHTYWNNEAFIETYWKNEAFIQMGDSGSFGAAWFRTLCP